MIAQPELDLFGSFPGHDLPADDAEGLLWLLWPDKERKLEPALFGQKWWDYRTLGVAHATYLFSHLLTVELRRLIRAHVDNAPPRVAANGTVLDWHPIKAGDVFDPPAQASRMPYWRRKIGGLIRARQAADADGIPYDVFIKAGLGHFFFGGGTYVMLRSGQNQRSLIPEPNLLYGDDCLAHIRETWLGQINAKVQSAQHPRYRLCNDDGHPDHREHRDWLTQQLAARHVREWAAARLVKQGLMLKNQALPMVRDVRLFNRLLANP